MQFIGKILTPYGKLISDGSVDSSFEDKTKADIDHFKEIYKAESRISIAEAVKMTSFFPSFVND